MVIKSPKKAIHTFCQECSGSLKVATACTKKSCLLYAFRTGHVSREVKHEPVLSSIREYCVICIGSRSEVERCTGKDCFLYSFRMGNNPFRKEMTPEQIERQSKILEEARKKNPLINKALLNARTQDNSKKVVLHFGEN